MANTKQASNKNKTTSPLDNIKWIFVALLILSGIVLNQYYVSEPLSLRLIAGIVLSALCVGILLTTVRGKYCLDVARAAHLELRKVVWPTRDEVVQTTFIVIGMVFIVSMILWGIDSVLLWGVGLLTGQRG